MDGQSLWSIRKHGWFELGFNDRYFVEVLAAEGWLATKYASGDTPVADVWVARRYRGEPFVFSATDGRIIVPSEMRDSAGIALQNLAEQWGFFGPYITLPAGKWLARVVLQQNSPREGRGTLDVCAGADHQVLASQQFELGELAPDKHNLEIEVSLERAVSDVEVRFHCETAVCLAVTRIELTPRV